jgi:hypothetical protein
VLPLLSCLVWWGKQAVYSENTRRTFSSTKRRGTLCLWLQRFGWWRLWQKLLWEIWIRIPIWLYQSIEDHLLEYDLTVIKFWDIQTIFCWSHVAVLYGNRDGMGAATIWDLS